MSTARWIDVDPQDWFYRAVIDSERVYLDPKKEDTLFNGKLFNKFIAGKPRSVFNFTTTEGQTEFPIPNFKPNSKETVLVYIDSVPYPPSKLETGKVTIGMPIAGGKEVSVFLSGVPDMKQGDHTPENCQTYPLTDGCKRSYPSKDLDKKADYVFDLKYRLNETAVWMNQKLQRVNVDILAGETTQEALERVIGHKRNCFTILNGVLYVSYNLNNFPVTVSYNYKSGAVIKNRQREKLVPTSKCVLINDMFFPYISLSRAQFFALLHRMRTALYNKFTDRLYVPNDPTLTSRQVSDSDKILGKWYEEDVFNMLDETFNDGCYVFPLFDDDSFQPEVCVTRAEAVMYLHRFTEWALERFR